MTAGSLDIICTKGTSFSTSIIVKNPDDLLAGLSYWGSRMQVRRTVSASSSLIELTTENGRLQHDIENAKITMSLTAEETNGLELGDHVYDLELYSTGSKTAVLRLVKGNFIVE